MTAKQEQCALLLAKGETAEAAAQAVGVDARTVRRWSGQADFRAEVTRLRDRIIDEALARLVGCLEGAVSALHDLVQPGREDRVRLRAASEILSNLLSVRTHVELSARVAALEEHTHGKPA